MIRGSWWAIGHSFVWPACCGESVVCGEGYRSSGHAVNSSPSECGREWPILSENVISRGDLFGFGLDGMYELGRQKTKEQRVV